MELVLHLVVAVGMAAKVSRRKFGTINPLELLNATLTRLKPTSLTPEIIRKTPTEILERALLAVEDICVAIFDQQSDAVATVVENQIYLSISEVYCCCPFLERSQ